MGVYKDLIFMIQSVNDTPADAKNPDLLLSAMRVLRASTDLISSLERKGWWEGTAEQFEAVRGLEAFDMDGDGDEDAADKAIAAELNEKAEAQQEAHDADVEAGRAV